jgi:inward rectifier potassium channel
MAPRDAFPRAVPRGPHDTGPAAIAIGAPARPLSDLYYRLLRAPWSALIAFLVAAYLAVNALFALGYFLTGGIEGARAGSLEDAFFFSVQTMATIGYGAMYPKTALAHAMVTAEALLGMLGVAMATGILFAKFARPVARVTFSEVAVVSRRDGVPSLMFRVSNERKNHIVEAKMTLYLLRNERTREGETVRRWHELRLARSVSPVFALTWTVVHPIDAASPLHGATPESLEAEQAEFVAVMTGADATLSSSIHARFSYVPQEVRFGERFVDIIATEGGRRVVDMRKFHMTARVDG